jgi:hypothetical protein
MNDITRSLADSRKRLPNRRASEVFELEAGGLRYTASVSQHGADAEAIRHALSRDAQGRALGPLGVALDIIAGERGR